MKEEIHKIQWLYDPLSTILSQWLQVAGAIIQITCYKYVLPTFNAVAF